MRRMLSPSEIKSKEKKLHVSIIFLCLSTFFQQIILLLLINIERDKCTGGPLIFLGCHLGPSTLKIALLKCII